MRLLIFTKYMTSFGLSSSRPFLKVRRFDKLSANGFYLKLTAYPFVLSLSKHERKSHFLQFNHYLKIQKQCRKNFNKTNKNKSANAVANSMNCVKTAALLFLPTSAVMWWQVSCWQNMAKSPKKIWKPNLYG